MACRVKKQQQDNVYCVPNWEKPSDGGRTLLLEIFSLVNAFCSIKLLQEGIHHPSRGK